MKKGQVLIRNFNSIKVQLEPSEPAEPRQQVPYFNSIKVQLERASHGIARKCVSTFQFHKGTIRTGSVLLKFPSSTYFNSIKVQLEPEYSFNKNGRWMKFQFHKGTIRTFKIRIWARTKLNEISIP